MIQPPGKPAPSTCFTKTTKKDTYVNLSPTFHGRLGNGPKSKPIFQVPAHSCHGSGRVTQKSFAVDPSAKSLTFCGFSGKPLDFQKS